MPAISTAPAMPVSSLRRVLLGGGVSCTVASLWSRVGSASAMGILLGALAGVGGGGGGGARPAAERAHQRDVEGEGAGFEIDDRALLLEHAVLRGEHRQVGRKPAFVALAGDVIGFLCVAQRLAGINERGAAVCPG